MKNFIRIAFTTALSIFAINYLVFAFTEPTGPPPTNNVPAPLNVGSGRQVKSGDITVQNLKAGSITLGEDTRTAWPGSVGGGGNACAWEGTKCTCMSDSTTGWWGGKTIRIITKMTCSQGRVTDYGVSDFRIGDDKNDYYARCYNGQGGEGCTPSLYTSYDQH